jgi:cell division protein FtsL
MERVLPRRWQSLSRIEKFFVILIVVFLALAFSALSLEAITSAALALIAR